MLRQNCTFRVVVFVNFHFNIYSLVVQVVWAEISFPIGGIGSGCIGLAGNGHIKDFEIFNRPNKNSYNTYTSIVVKAIGTTFRVIAEQLNLAVELKIALS